MLTSERTQYSCDSCWWMSRFLTFHSKIKKDTTFRIRLDRYLKRKKVHAIAIRYSDGCLASSQAKQHLDGCASQAKIRCRKKRYDPTKRSMCTMVDLEQLVARAGRSFYLEICSSNSERNHAMVKRNSEIEETLWREDPQSKLETRSCQVSSIKFCKKPNTRSKPSS